MSNTADVLQMSLVRGVGGVVSHVYACLAQVDAGWTMGVSGSRELGCDALPILWGQGECWTCV